MVAFRIARVTLADLRDDIFERKDHRDVL